MLQGYHASTCKPIHLFPVAGTAALKCGNCAEAGLAVVRVLLLAALYIHAGD